MATAKLKLAALAALYMTLALAGIVWGLEQCPLTDLPMID